MRVDPMVVYETEPATEWILGEPVQKVSPRYAHAALQGVTFSRLRAWAHNRGRVGTEWRFWLTPPGEEARYLVPDVAYLSYERLAQGDVAAAQEPEIAPNVAIEILSPDDRPAHLAHKIDVYLRSGAEAVVVVDAVTRTIRAHAASGVGVFAADEVFEHAALPGFTLPLLEFFSELTR